MSDGEGGALRSKDEDTNVCCYGHPMASNPSHVVDQPVTPELTSVS